MLIFHLIEVSIDSINVCLGNVVALGGIGVSRADLLRLSWILHSLEPSLIILLEDPSIKHSLDLLSHGLSSLDLLVQTLNLLLHRSHLAQLTLDISSMSLLSLFLFFYHCLTPASLG